MGLTDPITHSRPAVRWTRDLWLVVAPVAFCAIVMKALRVWPGEWPWWTSALALAPDALFVFGLVGLLTALIATTHHTPFRVMGLILAQCVAALTFAIHALAFGYFRATGLVLDYAMFRFSLGRAREAAPVVASEINVPTVLFLVAVPLWIAIAPWFRRVRPPPTATIKPPRWLAPLALLSSIVGSGTSYFITIDGVPTSVTREPVIHLASGFIATAYRAAAPEPLVPPPRRSGPRRVVTTDQTRKHNVVIIVLESTRSDATSAYNPALRTTPFLAEISQSATRVERAYAIVPHTSKALVAILCGIEPRPSLDIVEATEGGLPAQCLARLLTGVGYDTVYFQAPMSDFEYRAQLVKNMGYARFIAGDHMPTEGFERVNYFGYEDAIMVGPSQQWLRTQAREPFLATYLTSASHHPYTVPSTHPKQEFAQGRKNDYLNAVRYVDGVVEQIVNQYKEAGLYDRTVFVVVGDHGEGFGEHRLSTHDDVLYEEGLRVPLIVRVPGAAPTPRTVPGPVNQLAIVPTILDILGLRAIDGRYESASIFDERAAPRTLYAACYRNAQCLAMIRDGMKLLYFYDDSPALLFELGNDPAERKDLAGSRRDQVARWSEDLRRWTMAVEETYKAASRGAVAQYVSRSKPKPVGPALNTRFGTYLDVLSCSAKRRKQSIVAVKCQLRVVAPLNDDFRLRLHGSTPTARDVFDHKPVRGLYPMRDWQPGEYVTDSFDMRPPGAWERQPNQLCLELVDPTGRPVPLVPPHPDHPTCLPFATVPARPPADTQAP